jgi:hypothetical protein
VLIIVRERTYTLENRDSAQNARSLHFSLVAFVFFGGPGVRFVRFVYEPGYVTANVGSLRRSARQLRSPVWWYVLVSPVSCYRVLKHVAAGSPLSV